MSLPTSFKSHQPDPISVLVPVYGFGRWPTQISFHAGNLRAAVLGRDRQMLEASKRAVESLDLGGDRTELDSERLELLRALSDSLGPTTDRSAFSTVGAQLALLHHIEDYAPGRRASRI